jgi:hypothetical protein
MTVLFANDTEVAEYIDKAMQDYDLVTVLERHGVHLRRSGRGMSGACFDSMAHTGKNKHNLSVYQEGDTWFYHCFGCGKSGNVLTFIKERYNLRNGLEAAMMLRDDYEVNPIERRQYKRPENPPLDEDIATIYHNNLKKHPRAVQWWLDQGLNQTTINHFKVGCCAGFPVKNGDTGLYEPKHTYTIPVYQQGELKTIRHRIHGEKSGNKYRPERSGDGAFLFNSDTLSDKNYPDDCALIVAGEKKVMVIWQECGLMMPVVSATAGCSNWFREYGEQWMRMLMGREVYIGFDPNEINQAEHTAWLFGRFAKIVEFEDNPDDLITKHEDGLTKFWNAIADAKVYRDRSFWSLD